MPSLQLRIFSEAFSHVFETWKQALKMCWLHRFLPKQLKHRWRDCLWKQTSWLGNICVFWRIRYGICFCLTRVSSSVSKIIVRNNPQSGAVTSAHVGRHRCELCVCVRARICVCVCIHLDERKPRPRKPWGWGWNTGHRSPWLCSTFPPKDQLSALKSLC